MDLRLYGSVLWRYRLLVAVGWVVACTAAFFSFYSIGGDGVTPRQSVTFNAQQDLYITARGFAEGRAAVPVEGQEGASGEEASVLADSDRLTGLTTLYGELIDSDRVREIMEREGPVEGEVVGEQYVLNSGRTALPLLRLTASAPSEQAAVERAQRQAAAFQEFLGEEQIAAGIPPADRVVVEVLRAADSATVVEGRSIVVPMVLFLAVLAFTVALAFVVQNVQGAPAPRRDDERPEHPDAAVSGGERRPAAVSAPEAARGH